jgi:hypothetical protein
MSMSRRSFLGALGALVALGIAGGTLLPQEEEPPP